MNAPKYINTNIIYQKNIQYSKEAHEKRLKHIKSRKSGIYGYSSDPNKLPHIKNR